MATCRKISKERMALKISLAGTIFVASLGIGYGLYVGSNAILLDGMFSFLSMGMTGLSLYTAYLVSKPDDEQFQFGYAHFEPLINVVNGLLILITCLFAFITGVQTIMHGGHDIVLGDAIIYAVLSTVSCFSIYFFETHIARSVDSELVRVDSQEWLVDAILSAAILVGFILVVIFDALGYSKWNAYVDPILVTTLSIAASILPIKVLRRNLKEVLLVAPQDSAQEHVDQVIAELSEKYDFDDYTHHFAKIGRQYDLEINILVKDENKWTTKQQDRIRQIIWDRLEDDLGETWLSVSFTAQERWL
ncbi:cation diffusion facilitator family transporter [Photobacterium leiognathi]|uniref:Cation diffusion facilitator transporter family protein n=2 Tax=Photobacterium leiognathi TaxID=553611 RepID=V5F808_PHOLE|nr:cation diffusion facilitator family transporter [Photobacterium leiognathi]KJF91972.1 cation diffusion facilitator family transporter [Photobacterium leiognathi]MCG3886260.1 cation diffusion facilitator family transporter [Photobacterium leiognathi]PSV01240.1 cation transporter [Photobacterium leiognathi subsp. mandapamensis]PSV86631.1 cation transporter [Photobacterium leiognathi]GAD31484.1 cation diffusion facilitator transporter family protein [Photobacterium leiognathi lrivu.4.1]